MMTFELWTHPQSGAVYAFRLEDGTVTGCRGPLAPGETTADDFAVHLFEELPDAVRRVAESPEPFSQAADGLPRQSVTARPARGDSVFQRARERVAARRRTRRRA